MNIWRARTGTQIRTAGLQLGAVAHTVGAVGDAVREGAWPVAHTIAAPARDGTVVPRIPRRPHTVNWIMR